MILKILPMLISKNSIDITQKNIYFCIFMFWLDSDTAVLLSRVLWVGGKYWVYWSIVGSARPTFGNGILSIWLLTDEVVSAAAVAAAFRPCAPNNILSSFVEFDASRSWLVGLGELPMNLIRFVFSMGLDKLTSIDDPSMRAPFCSIINIFSILIQNRNKLIN